MISVFVRLSHGDVKVCVTPLTSRPVAEFVLTVAVV